MSPSKPTLTGPQRGVQSHLKAFSEELRHQTMDSGHSFRVGVSRTGDQLHPDSHNLIYYWPLQQGVFSRPFSLLYLFRPF